jgi:hypothetical protein
MAAPCASFTGGDSSVVRDFQSLNWGYDRITRRLVRHLVNDLRASISCKPVSIPELIKAINNIFPRT